MKQQFIIMQQQCYYYATAQMITCHIDYMSRLKILQSTVSKN